jgi:tetratricopeptide (TPR) repeat protein
MYEFVFKTIIMFTLCLIMAFHSGSAGALQAGDLKHKGWLISMEMYKDKAVLEKARNLFLQAQKLNPDDASLDYYIGYTYFKEGEFALIHEQDKEKARTFYEKALEWAEKGIKKDPESIECRFGRAACLARILDTKYAGKSTLRNLFSLGGIAPKLRRIEGDIEFVLSHSKETPPDIRESYDYAYLATVIKASLDWFYPGILGGSKEKALDKLQAAHSRHPGDPLPYYTMARLYFEIEKDYPKANEYCQKVINWKKPYYFFDYYAFYRPHCEEILKAVQQATAQAKR